MTWQKVNENYATNDFYSMTSVKGVSLPFGLYKQNQLIGCYATAKEAYDVHAEIVVDSSRAMI